MNMAVWRREWPSFQTPLRTLAPKKTPAVLKGGMILEALSESRMMRQVWRGVSSKAMDVSCHGHGTVVNNIMNTIMNSRVPGLHVAFHRSSQCCLLFYSKKGSSDIFWVVKHGWKIPKNVEPNGGFSSHGPKSWPSHGRRLRSAGAVCLME